MRENSIQALLVDADAGRRAATRALLQSQQDPAIDVAEAETVEQALDHCIAVPPDCLVTACRLGDMDAISLIAALRLEASEQCPPVIVLGGPGDEVAAAETIKSGAYDFLPAAKFDAAALQRAVRNAVEKAELMRQITHQRIELERSHEALKKKHSELEQLAAIVSQDLQQPLASIHGYLELLADYAHRDLNPQAREWVNASLSVANRMSFRLRDLLEYATIESHGKTFETVDCDSAFSCALNHLEQAVSRNQATITHDNLPKILGDDNQICRLFQNLLRYALDSSGAGPARVHVSVRKDETEWLFAVEHRGSAISPVQAEFVFSALTPDRAGYGGRGVPLAVCKKIVERHGGRIWVESSAPGATFYFTLPLKSRLIQAQPELAGFLI